ncbi:N-6 DNA methylase [Kitasatospora sp. MBT63]|uniref:N-6 DNA methylase n=1 Tax=Kitasatospora sp. MBT63 TaxID=1444768 RepID=UPI0006914F61|nr:N-6 DNA methylase [Kitasatospora sp. MBT63]
MQFDLFNQPPENRPSLNIRKRATPPRVTREAAMAAAADLAHANRAVAAVTTPARRRYIRRPADPHTAALHLAEAVTSAWWRNGGTNRFEIAIGAVAGLALWPAKGRTIAPYVADWWRTLSATDILKALEECFARWWVVRPDLIECARPIHDWLTDESTRADFAAPVRAVVHAALNAGLLDLLGDDHPYLRSSTDVLGFLLTAFRSPSQREDLAEIHTPPDMADLMARMLLDGIGFEPGHSFDDPAAGSGGLHRAAAQTLRDAGRDPADFLWSMTDVDPIAASLCAVNAIVWGLGPNVLVWCGNTLTEGDGPRRAAKRRAEVIEHRDQYLRIAKMHAAIRGLLRPEPIAA